MRDTSFLNAFRAFAALWVLVAHCTIWGGYNLFHLPDPKEAVDLFMIISGFLMVFTVDRKSEPMSDVRSWIAFYVRRFFRIAPGYYLSLMALVIVWPLYAGGYEQFRALDPLRWASDTTYDPSRMVLDFKNVALHVTFLFGLSPSYSFSTMLPDWSLSLEMQFYALFPLLYLTLKNRSPWITFTVGTACIALSFVYERYGTRLGMLPFKEPSLLIFKLPIFLAGMMVHDAGKRGIRPALLLMAVWMLLGEHSLLFGSLSLLLIAAWIAPGVEAARRLAKGRFVSFASDCSYSVYLFHGFALSLVGAPILVALLRSGLSRPAAVGLMTGAVVFCTYPLAWLVFRTVEDPVNRWGSRIAKRLDKPMLTA